MKVGNRIVKISGLVSLLLVLQGITFGLVQGNRRPSMETYSLRILPVVSTAAPIQVRFAGVTTLLFDDSETAWIVDGFFTRPGKMKALAGRIEPDRGVIRRNLERLGVRDRLAAVVPAHSHYDHAMDAPVVAMLTGARLIGSESTLNIGRGLGMKEGSLQKVAPNETVSLGKWKLTFIVSRHSPTLLNPGGQIETINSPLVPPQHSLSWRAGETWAILIEHTSGASMLVNGSAGFVEHSLTGRHADVVFLGIGTLGKEPPAYREQLWNEVIRRASPRRVIAVHWDDFWQSLDKPLVALPYLVDDFDATMSHLDKLARRDHVELRLPPLYLPFDPLLPKK